jgi:hypothetical protein
MHGIGVKDFRGLGEVVEGRARPVQRQQGLAAIVARQGMAGLGRHRGIEAGQGFGRAAA